MASKAAKTTFESGPQDKVASSDQGLIASNVANNLLPVNSDNSLTSGVLGKLIAKTGVGGIAANLNAGLESFAEAATNSMPGNLVTRLQSVVDSGALNPDTLKARSKALGTDLDKLGGNILAETLKSTGYIDDATAKNLFGGGLNASIKNIKGVATGFKLMVDDVEHLVKDTDFGSVTGISNLITSVTGQKDLLKVLGIDDTLASLKLINDIANVWGIPKLADKLLGTLSTDEDKLTYLTDLLPSALTSAHIENINLCIDNLGAAFIMNQYPLAITTILGNYSISSDKTTPTKDDSVALINTLNRLNAHWHSYDRSGAWIYDLKVFATATDTARTALEMDTALLMPTLYVVSNNVIEQTWEEVFKTFYPYS